MSRKQVKGTETWETVKNLKKVKENITNQINQKKEHDKIRKRTRSLILSKQIKGIKANKIKEWKKLI